MQTIRVKYSCHLCGLRNIEVDVPARRTEDVLEWMDGTVRLLGRDHARRSPRCHPTQLKDVMIPMPPGTDRIGDPITH